LPSYLTATGRAILAQLPKSEVLAMFQSQTEFVSRTGRGPTSVKAPNASLAQERRPGWASDDREGTPGAAAIAAPGYGVLGRAVSGDAPAGGGTEGEALEPIVDRVLEAAAEVTAKLR